MAKLKKTYRYAIKSALFITIASIIFLWVSHLFFYEQYGMYYIMFFAILFFLASVFLIQYRAENFIYQRINQLYKDISILNESTLDKDKITTDIDSLAKNVKETVKGFVEDKKVEIAYLTEKDSFRREFIGDVSHELKTPLFTVQGYIMTLIDGVDDEVIRKKYLKRAGKGIERLSSIVQDLDMIGKLETEGMMIKMEKFNIVELIQNVFDLLEMKSKKRGIRLKFKTKYKPTFVKADIKRIEQVLINLIVNSIKYGKVNGITTVKIEEKNSSKILIRVQDNGEGIESKNKKRLFERFYRVDRSRSREEGGSGLGLSIVKHIIEAHNEKIKVKSVLGEGTDFYFSLKKA